MIELIGRSLFQWDIGRQVKIKTPETVSEVHFARLGDSEALVVEPKTVGGEIVAEIPNIHLQEARNITVFLVKDDVTIERCTFQVIKREKPADYIYTETETKTFDVLKAYVYNKEFCNSEEKTTGNFTTEQSAIYEKTLEFTVGRIPIEAEFIPTVTAWCTILSKSIELDGDKVSVRLQIGGLGNTEQANVGGFVMYRSDKDKDAEAFKTFLDEINGEVI